jgi:hypothetical protein
MSIARNIQYNAHQMTKYFDSRGSEHVILKTAPERHRDAAFSIRLSYPYPDTLPFTGGACGGKIPRKWYREFTGNPSIGHNSERSAFRAENEQKVQAGMATFSKSPKPHDLQSTLPKMRPQMQAEFPGRRDRLPALSIQTGEKELLMSNEKVVNINAANNAVPLPVQGGERPTLVKKIGKTTYKVTIHFSSTNRETMSDKIKRMLRNEVSQT